MNSAEQQVTDTGTAGVIARPILLFPAALLLGFVADRVLPLPFRVPTIGLVHLISTIIAGSLIFIGISLFVAGVKNFSRAATPLPTSQPARALVTCTSASA
jgi:hypothetical protein